MKRVIKAHKGGRTKRHTFAMTPAIWQRIQDQVKAKGISLNDWLESKVTEHTPEPVDSSKHL